MAVSDGPIQGFTGGWAIIPFPGSRAHYWRPIFLPVALIGRRGRAIPWESLCGQIRATNDGIQALGAGDFPNCKRCARKVAP